LNETGNYATGAILFPVGRQGSWIQVKRPPERREIRPPSVRDNKSWIGLVATAARAHLGGRTPAVWMATGGLRVKPCRLAAASTAPTPLELELTLSGLSAPRKGPAADKASPPAGQDRKASSAREPRPDVKALARDQAESGLPMSRLRP
jgi:hypothetical protein